MKTNLKLYSLTLVAIAVAFSSCKKLVSIPEPTDTITTVKVFSNDNEANSAMAGVYTLMINNDSNGATGLLGFATGMSTLYGAMSANELIASTTNGQDYLFNQNRLTADIGSTAIIWKTAYTAIYGSNAVIEGVEASVSPKLHDEVRKKLTGEAKFVRAFTYFYLVNFFGDVPMVLTVDFNKTATMKKTPKNEVYAQMIKDLLDAKSLLSADFSGGGGERILPTKWAATALLARAYLYTGDYANASAQASEVIGQAALFNLPADLNTVFLSTSQEAIWQLKQSTLPANKNATPEGTTLFSKPAYYYVSKELENDFEMEDQRKEAWFHRDSLQGKPVYQAYKYKTGQANSSITGTVTEYSVVLRLAEQYLIRAEAQTLGGLSLSQAIADLNVIRKRAGLNNLPITLSKNEVTKAIEHEREIELFAEWGHRWFDLKRTGRAHDVLSAVQIKQPWTGDYQLLYPIPRSEIITNQNLIQNPGY
nr:RagB/SusD family nutrient uptake outer membrane protein [Pedobacter sp. ASV19]